MTGSPAFDPRVVEAVWINNHLIDRPYIELLQQHLCPDYCHKTFTSYLTFYVTL